VVGSDVFDPGQHAATDTDRVPAVLAEKNLLEAILLSWHYDGVTGVSSIFEKAWCGWDPPLIQLTVDSSMMA
jgi:hypothetical protein